MFQSSVTVMQHHWNTESVITLPSCTILLLLHCSTFSSQPNTAASKKMCSYSVIIITKTLFCFFQLHNSLGAFRFLCVNQTFLAGDNSKLPLEQILHPQRAVISQWPAINPYLLCCGTSRNNADGNNLSFQASDQLEF